MGLLKTAAKVGVATSVHGRVQRRQQQRWAAQDQWNAARPPAPGTMAAEPAGAPAAAPVSTAEKLAQLKTLAELRDGGVLTDAEFEAEKRKLLAS